VGKKKEEKKKKIIQAATGNIDIEKDTGDW